MRWKKSKLLFLVPFLLAPKAWCVPSITSATSTGVAKGATLTISGSGFGTKSPSLPLAWSDFEASSKAISSLSSQPNQLDGTMVQSSTYSSWDGSSFVLATDFRVNQGGKEQLNQTLSGASTVYVYCDRLTSFSTQGINQFKFFRIWSTSLSSPDFLSEYGSAGVGAVSYNEVDTNYPNRFDNNSMYTSSMTWMSERMIWTHGNITSPAPPGDTADGTYRYFRNGFKWVDKSDIPNGGYQGNTMGQGGIFIDAENENGIQPPTGAYELVDNVYIDTTYAVMEISTCSTLSANCAMIPQPATAWSATSITAYLHYDQFASTMTFYAYVTDASSSTNTSGTQLTLSSSGGNTPAGFGTIILKQSTKANFQDRDDLVTLEPSTQKEVWKKDEKLRLSSSIDFDPIYPE